MEAEDRCCHGYPKMNYANSDDKEVLYCQEMNLCGAREECERRGIWWLAKESLESVKQLASLGLGDAVYELNKRRHGNA